MEQLTVKHLSKISFMELLTFILTKVGVCDVFFSEKEPAVKGALFLNVPSLEIPLTGKKHIIFAGPEGVEDRILRPGEVLCSPALHWKKPVWDYEHEMSSILFAPDHVKITYIDSKGTGAFYAEHPASVFYRTSQPVGAPARSLLRALESMVENREKTGAVKVVEALLQMTLETLRLDSGKCLNKGERTWVLVNQYLESHFASPINRAHVAAMFKLHPSHISRLFKERGDESFSGKLLRLRLRHASELLRKTNLTIDEIADACGYSSTTYFISAFRKAYGTSPGRYRNQKKLLH